MPLNFNPFVLYGITEYNTFKKYPFLESKSISRIKNIVQGQIRDNFRIPERLLLLGEPGIGKSSSLFYIYDLLNDSKKCSVFIFDKFFSNSEEFEIETKSNLTETTKQKTYILVDFPDTINAIRFKNFLDYLWKLMHHQNSENINFVFALNISHYNRSFNLSEILGKFHNFRLERMDKQESIQLINARLKMANKKITTFNNYFEEGVYDIIFKYSKGIPRNIICASRNLVDEFFNKGVIIEEQAKKILKENFIEQIINDRIEDPNKRILYKSIVSIIKQDFNQTVPAQQLLIEKLRKKMDIGRNKTMNIISDLYKFGIITLTRGGENNTKKIISLK